MTFDLFQRIKGLQTYLAAAPGIDQSLSIVDYCELLDRAIQNNLAAEIERLDARLQEFIAWHDRFPTPVAIKTAAVERGLKVGPLAAPLAPAGQKRLEEFREWFKAWLPEVQKESVIA